MPGHLTESSSLISYPFGFLSRCTDHSDVDAYCGIVRAVGSFGRLGRVECLVEDSKGEYKLFIGIFRLAVIASPISSAQPLTLVLLLSANYLGQRRFIGKGHRLLLYYSSFLHAFLKHLIDSFV